MQNVTNPVRLSFTYLLCASVTIIRYSANYITRGNKAKCKQRYLFLTLYAYLIIYIAWLITYHLVVLLVNGEQLQTARPNSCDVLAALRYHNLVSRYTS